MRLGKLGGAILALGCVASQARAAELQGWGPLSVKDPVADAVAQGAQFQRGDDVLVLFCREHDGAKHFIARWLTAYKLGRGGLREVVYRFDQQHPFSEDWFYTSRNAEAGAPTLWMDPSRRFARRLLDSSAAQMVFRLKSHDGDIHDIAVPLDETARGLIRPALERCS